MGPSGLSVPVKFPERWLQLVVDIHTSRAMKSAGTAAQKAEIVSGPQEIPASSQEGRLSRGHNQSVPWTRYLYFPGRVPVDGIVHCDHLGPGSSVK